MILEDNERFSGESKAPFGGWGKGIKNFLKFLSFLFAYASKTFSNRSVGGEGKEISIFSKKLFFFIRRT